MTLTALAEVTLLGVPVGLALGLVGGGGSVLTVPILIGVLGVPPHFATSASLVIVAANASSALWTYMQDRLVQYRVAVSLVASGVLGTVLGTLLNRYVDPNVLTLAFAVLMVGVALQMLRRAEARAYSPPAHVSLPKLFAAGSLVGLTTGFFGVGGGFVIVPALLSLGLDMRQAVPTSLLVIVLNSLIALGLRVMGGADVPLGYALPMIVGGVAGSALAVKLAPKLGNTGLTRTFAVFVLILAVYLAWTVKGTHV